MKTRLPVLFIMITLVMPDLIRELRGSNLASAALWGGVLASSFAVMQF